MLDRIQKAKPFYSDKELRKHSKRHTQLKNQVSEFATGRRGQGVETGRPPTAVLSPIKGQPGSSSRKQGGRSRSRSRGPLKRPQTAKPYRTTEGREQRRPASAAVWEKDGSVRGEHKGSEHSPYITDHRAFGNRPPEREGMRRGARPFSAPTDFDQYHSRVSKMEEEQAAGIIEDDSAESNDFERQIMLAQSGYGESSKAEEGRYQRPVSAGSRRRGQVSEGKAPEETTDAFIASAADGWKSEEEKKAFEEEFAREFSTSESRKTRNYHDGGEPSPSQGVRDDSNGSLRSEGGASQSNTSDGFEQLSRFGAAPSAATEGSSGSRPTSARRRGRSTNAAGSATGIEEGIAMRTDRNEYIPPRTRSGERLRAADEDDKSDTQERSSDGKEDATVNRGSKADDWDDQLDLSVTGNAAASGSSARSREKPLHSPTCRGKADLGDENRADGDTNLSLSGHPSASGGDSARLNSGKPCNDTFVEEGTSDHLDNTQDDQPYPGEKDMQDNADNTDSYNQLFSRAAPNEVTDASSSVCVENSNDTDRDGFNPTANRGFGNIDFEEQKNHGAEEGQTNHGSEEEEKNDGSEEEQKNHGGEEEQKNHGGEEEQKNHDGEEALAEGDEDRRDIQPSGESEQAEGDDDHNDSTQRSEAVENGSPAAEDSAFGQSIQHQDVESTERDSEQADQPSEQAEADDEHHDSNERMENSTYEEDTEQKHPTDTNVVDS